MKIVKLTLFKRVPTLSTMLPSSGRLSVYQDATRACIKVPYDFSPWVMALRKSLEIGAIHVKLLTFRVS